MVKSMESDGKAILSALIVYICYAFTILHRAFNALDVCHRDLLKCKIRPSPFNGIIYINKCGNMRTIFTLRTNICFTYTINMF